MIFMNSLLATTAEILKFETALLFVALGGLLVLAKIVADLRNEVRLLRGGTSGKTLSSATNPPAPVPGSSTPQEIPEEVLAAIVAAVYCTLGDHHQIVSVSSSETLMWSREGRRSIFRSHTFR